MLICFDYDGVIADTFDKLLNICKDSQKSLGVGRAPVEADFRETQNLTFDYLATELGIPQCSVSEFAGQVFSRLGAGSDDIFCGMSDVLNDLTVDHTLCVVTANTVTKVEATLKASGIRACFSSVFGGEERLAKSEQITRARETHGFDNCETIMVGDTLGDIRMAKEAGVRSIAVSWGYQSREFLKQTAPDHCADSPKDLLDIVNNLQPLNS